MKSTKKSLLASGLALLASVALLAGTTFAWFTDSVTNTGNRIQAGNLQVDLVHVGAGADHSDVSLKDTPLHKVFDYDRWEPGYTAVETLRVVNEGSLALKFNLTASTEGATTGANGENLADVIDVYVYEGTDPTTALTDPGWRNAGALSALMADPDGVAYGILLPADAQATEDLPAGSVEMTVALHMQEEAGNGYRGLSLGDLSFILNATQYTYEQDGFGSSDYDADATLNFASVATADDLEQALTEGKTASLTEDIALDETLQVTGDITIQGNGNTLTIPDNADRVINVTGSTEPITITLSNVDMVGPTEGTYTRGISFFETKDVTLVMDNCSLSANYYAINAASANENLKVIVRNSTITGWCAFQTHSPYADITFENCTLIGLNDKSYNADGWNDFATIVINRYSDGNPDPNGAHDCTLTFRNCRIEANQTTGNVQYLLSVRAENTTIVAENCSFYVNGTEISQDELPEYVAVYPEVLDTFDFTIR